MHGVVMAHDPESDSLMAPSRRWLFASIWLVIWVLICGSANSDSATPAQPLWSLQPIVKPLRPKVKDTSWVRTPIDRFILAKLEEKGLKPSPAADKRTLLRRIYFDLLGLPPTPQETDAF